MTICYLANAGNIHTIKWANHFAGQGHSVEIISFDGGRDLHPSVRVHRLGGLRVGNARYFLKMRAVRRMIDQAAPDLVHAHYASGYGTLAALAGRHPLIVSTWGSDVFEFPLRSPLHRWILRRNLQAADFVCSTSQRMAAELTKYTDKKVLLTPFGVDCSQFHPRDPVTSDEPGFVLGIVKNLEATSGIEYVLEALKILLSRRKDAKIRLDIVGAGRQEQRYKEMVEQMGLAPRVRFLGRVPHQEIPAILRTFSVYVSLPTAESFGVACLEASATGIPVIASDVGGVAEVVRDGGTGFLVPVRDPIRAADALERLLECPEQRAALGNAGRAWVLDQFEWRKTAKIMEQLYERVAGVRDDVRR